MVLSFSLFIVTGCNHNKSEEKTEKMQEKKAPTYGMENVDGMEIMKTIQEEFGIDIDSDPVDPTITEGVPKKFTVPDLKMIYGIVLKLKMLLVLSL